jgi:hypothetical protein
MITIGLPKVILLKARDSNKIYYFATTLITFEPILVPLVFFAKIRYQYVIAATTVESVNDSVVGTPILA